MYISDLELHGFKSFAHKTHVRFDSGITAVVGPNGCGKSNIVDALRWVLGEQRPTLLRSSAMSNVIFNGTAKKKALGMAEVSLTFVNNKGLLPSEYSELTITRRLYRSGESDYLINDTPVRLRDIIDLFMDTGMSSDAYSVIELKMVEEILNDRNNDRRRMLEEAAGVTRYKEKRRQTLRKLDETNKDLQRLEDILVEVRKKTRSLELQSQRAVKAKGYREELVQLDKTVQARSWKQIRDQQEPLKKQIETASAKRAELAKQLESLEQQEEKLRTGLLEKERAENDLRRQVQQLSNQKREKETRSQILKGKIGNEEGVIRQYQADIEQSEKDLVELQELRTTRRGELEKLSAKRDQSAASLEESGKTFSGLQKAYTELRKELFDLEVAISAKGKKHQDMRSNRIRLESRLENSEGDQKRVQGEIERLEKEIRDSKEQLEKEKALVQEFSNKIEAVEKKLAGVRETRETLLNERNEARDQEREVLSRQDAVASEIGLLHHLASSTDAFPGSVAWLMEEHKEEFSVLSPVSELIQTDEGHAVALEAALGEAQNYLVVESFRDAERASALLKKHKKGQATFIPLDWMPKGGAGDAREGLKLRDGSHINPIGNVIKTDGAYRGMAELLLGHVYLMDDGAGAGAADSGATVDAGSASDKAGASSGMTKESREWLQKNREAALVTLSGELISSGGLFKSGSKSHQTGLRLGLKNKLEKLEKQERSLQKELDRTRDVLEQIDQKLAGLNEQQVRDEIATLQKERRERDQTVGKLQSGIQIYDRSILEQQAHRERLALAEGQSQEQLEKLVPELEKIDGEIGALREKEESARTMLQKLEDERAIAQNRYNDAQLKFQDISNRTANIEQDLQRADERTERIEERLEQRRGLLEQSRENVRLYKQESAEIAGMMGGLAEKLEAEQKALELAEQQSKGDREQIQEQDKELRTLRKSWEDQLELLHHLTMAAEKFDLQLETITNTVWETYDLTMDQLMGEVDLQDESFDVDAAKERVSVLRQKLHRIGEVNPLAIEEFREEKERLDFYEQQMEDLRKAEAEMRDTIAEINATATERFHETFQLIRTHFQDVFHRLFEEDDFCDLVLDRDSEDPLEAKVEIKANPKGKRPSNISQLSGGEKTLTAIAFLFAIYLVKPSPFCVLDEVDAPLDDANIERFSGMIRSFAEQTQFIIITHNKKTMSKAEMMYGVTMPETGVSRLVGVRLDDVGA